MGREQESGTTEDGSKRGSRRYSLHFHAIWQIFGEENMPRFVVYERMF